MLHSPPLSPPPFSSKWTTSPIRYVASWQDRIALVGSLVAHSCWALWPSWLDHHMNPRPNSLQEYDLI